MVSVPSSKANQGSELLCVEYPGINIKCGLSYSSCISIFSPFPFFLTRCSEDFLLVPTNISFWQTVQIKRYGWAEETGTQICPLGFHLQLAATDTITADRNAEASGRVHVAAESCQAVIGKIIFNQSISYSPNIRNLL